MPSRKVPFVNGEFYHIFNRGNEKQFIFKCEVDRERFLHTLLYYQVEGPKPKLSQFLKQPKEALNTSKKLVQIVSFCLMNNHYHLLLTPSREGSVTEFMSKVGNSYTKYFNTRYNRIGTLFQAEFKSVFIETNNQLLQVNRYIHLNPLVGGLIERLEDYPWSSYLEYLGQLFPSVCIQEPILGQFSSRREYEEFIKDHANYILEIILIKDCLIDQE